MTNEGPSIDWDAFREAGMCGRLMELLVKLPWERWAERDEYGLTLLHYACVGPNVAAVKALLQSGLVDVNARNTDGNNAAHVAATYNRPRVLEVLCAAGVDSRAPNQNGRSALDQAVDYRCDDCALVLVANCVRLNTIAERLRRHITPELEAFERGVLRCRAVVVAMLRVKKAANLYHVDKFLMRELAYAMWATRTCDRWQK